VPDTPVEEPAAEAECEPVHTNPPHDPFKKIDEQLQRKFEEISACQVLTDELNRVRSQMVAEKARRQAIEAAMSDLEAAKDLIARKADAARQRELDQQEAIQALQARVQESAAKVAAAEAALQNQVRESRRLQARTKDLEEQLTDLTNQISAQLAIDVSRRRREAELEACVRNQQEEIAKTKAALAADGANIRRARERMQTTLSRVLEELQAQNGAPY
jgi:hypothetical protein